MKRTTGAEPISLAKVMNTDELCTAQQMVKEVLIADDLLSYAIQIVTATNSFSEDALEEIKQYVQYGSGPRGVQSIIKLAKARALVQGRFHVSIADIKAVAKPVLRCRMLLNYEGEAAGKVPDDMIDVILQKVQQGVAL